MANKPPPSLSENLYTPNCIRTHSGQYVNIFSPAAGTINIDDVAHAASNLPRFGGHLPYYYSPCGNYSCTYSVAQHCCAGHDYILMEYLNPYEAFIFLMHERAEALGMGDLASPIKHQLTDYMQAEQNFDKLTAPIFGLPHPATPLCKQVDRLMLEQEWCDIMLKGKPDYEVWFPHRAKQEFLDRYERYVKQIK